MKHLNLTPNHKICTSFFYSAYMSVEYTNSNLVSAQMAKLMQPAPKLELDLNIPQNQPYKVKSKTVLRSGEKKVGCMSSNRYTKISFF